MLHTNEERTKHYLKRLWVSCVVGICVFAVVGVLYPVFSLVSEVYSHSAEWTYSAPNETENGNTENNDTESGNTGEEENTDDEEDKPEGGFEIFGETVEIPFLQIQLLKVDASNISHYAGWRYGYYIVAMQEDVLPNTFLYARFVKAGPCTTMESTIKFINEMCKGDKLSLVFENAFGMITYTFTKE